MRRGGSSAAVNGPSADPACHHEYEAVRSELAIELVDQLDRLFLARADDGMDHLRQELEEPVVGTPEEVEPRIGEDLVLIPVQVVDPVLMDVAAGIRVPTVIRGHVA